MIVALWDEFTDDHLNAVVQSGYNWAEGALSIITEVYEDSDAAERPALLRLITIFIYQLEYIRLGNIVPTTRN